MCELIQIETLTLAVDKRLFAKMCGQERIRGVFCDGALYKLTFTLHFITGSLPSFFVATGHELQFET